MRVSDHLASNWKLVWAASFVLLKYLLLMEILQVPFMPSSFWLLPVSAALALAIISTALAIDIAAMIWSRVDQSLGRSHSCTSCRRGICWHGISRLQVLQDEYTVLLDPNIP
ncbi:hypothetical protein SAY86_002870 [Trapa natans]|uniref:Uncharacterized protein n=1 Tax=Trapa natans TaxID=22666 RepID=A0AAN7R3T3_TRANT|nr:hypothetical protein SAY86_002870 [Trapa natans]